MVIERIGCTTGRWPRYRLIVDGVDVGEVRRVNAQGCDRLAGNSRFSGWKIAGVVCATQEDAEKELVALAKRFGYI